jgi:protein associated with RNAse G/E
MTKQTLWREGDNVLLRGIYNDQVAYVESLRVVKDSPQETILSIWPGAECAAPRGYVDHGHALWDRWADTLSNSFHLKKYQWRTNRFLVILEPGKYYSIFYMWNAASDSFMGYYVNFQLPFWRTPLSFDTFDLDLDILVDPSQAWKWKDVDEYEHGIHVGGIMPDWVAKVERAKGEVISRIENRLYPFDASWLNWRPNPVWSAPYLPENWDVIHR